MNIFITNLPFTLNEIDIRSGFEQYGTVQSVGLPKDRERGCSKGYAFVEMPNESEALTAIKNIDGLVWHGRQVHVEPARSRQGAA